ncbi:hypothetical protein PN466_14685 [Roseofilum reptotaenium CS-1145]|nr:hypothetical protein [Roseofilum reptotaenium CS-1145]
MKSDRLSQVKDIFVDLGHGKDMPAQVFMTNGAIASSAYPGYDSMPLL